MSLWTKRRRWREARLLERIQAARRYGEALSIRPDSCWTVGTSAGEGETGRRFIASVNTETPDGMAGETEMNEKDDERPERVWITWDDAYPWEFERPDATAYVRADLVNSVAATGGFTCQCCGRSMELRVDGKYCNECGVYLATARKEAREAVFKDALGIIKTKRSKWARDGAPSDRLIGADYIREALERAAATDKEKQ